MKKLLVILATVLLISSLVIVGCAQPTPTTTPTPTPTPTPAPEAKVLKLGVIYGLSGPGSQAQLIWKDASVLCADWINQNGGITINGEKYQIECLVEDHKMTPPGAIDAATKLVYQDKVSFIIGGNVPVINNAIASVTEKNNIVYCSTRTDIVRPDQPYTFASNYGFAAPVPFLYEVLLEKYPSVKSIGFIVEDEPGARAIQGVSQGVATKKYGLTVLEPEIHPFEKPEYYPQWTKLMTSNPDAIDQGLKMPDSTANCVKQGRELGYKGPIFAAIPGDPNLILRMIGKEFATDFIFSTWDCYDTKNSPPMIAEIIALWEKSSKEPFDAGASSAWDATWCMVQAIEKAQSLDTTDVKNAWESIEVFETSRGPARLGGGKTFGINHMVFNPCPIIRFKDGQIEFLKWVDPWAP